MRLVQEALSSGDARQLLAYASHFIAAVFLWQALNPVTRWRYRHIPGPFGWPFVGNIVPIVRLQLHNYLHLMHQQYGPMFKIWFGGSPFIIVCEADAIRKASYKLNSHQGLPSTLLGEEQFVMANMLFFSRGDTWRLLKKAWDPALLHRSSLVGYTPLMQECGEALLERLEVVQQQGEAVDVWTELQRMTLDVVGTCAFGIKFCNSSGDAAAGSASAWGGNSEELRACCNRFFRTSMGSSSGSLWLVPVLMLPQFAGAVRWLAYRLPDKGHTMTVQCIQGMVSAARKIIAVSGAEREQSQSEPPRPDAAAERDQKPAATAAAAVMANCQGRTATGKQQGILPGSFVAQLEAWRAKHDSAGQLTDNLIAAQVITFLLVGYETTANALAFLLYRISIHPDAQQKLQQEVDAVLGGRKPTLEDLPKLKYLDACTKESMRLHPVVPVLSRIYDNDTVHPSTLELCGRAIPKGAHVVPLLSSAAKSPQYWERPEEFLPERFLPETGGKLGPFNENAFLPFGAGGRKCTGYKFAEQEMALVTAALLQRFSFTRPPGEGPLKEAMGVALAPKDGVKVLLRARV